MSYEKKLQIFLSLLVLSGLIYFVGFSELFAALCQINISYILLLLLLGIILIWISCLKWKLFISASGGDVPIVYLMKLYVVGYFFNIFTPSFVGGDLARSFHLGRYLENHQDAFVSTFLERFTGLLAMSLLGVSFVLIGTQATRGIEGSIIFLGLVTSTIALVCFSRVCANLAKNVLIKLTSFLGLKQVSVNLEKLFFKIQSAMEVVHGKPQLFIKAMFLSLLYHSFTVANTYVAACAVGWESPSIGGLFICVPLVLLIGMIPLTPSGLGIQEGAFLYFLKQIGASQAQGLSVGLLLRAKVILIGLVGGLFWLIIRRQPSSPVLQFDRA